jgi:hemolysin activation/secretion protein
VGKAGHAGLGALSCLCCIAVATHAEAQSPGQSIERRLGPREEQLPKPQLLPEQEAPPLTPPQAPAPSPPPEAGGLRIFVSSIRVVGSTVFSEDEIRTVTAPSEGRVLSTTDLQNVANAITRLYVDHGYINSGAIIPDQDVVNGVVTIQVIEGSLDEIDIEGLQLLRKSYLENRIRRGAGPPLRVQDLQERMQILLDDPLIERLDARLGPSARLGAARLDVKAVEAPRFAGSSRFDNFRSPAVGELGSEGDLTVRNAFGFGDPMRLEVEGSEGLRRIALNYALPITDFDLRPFIAGEYTKSKVVEHPFENLHIESNTGTIEFGLRLPVWQRAEPRTDEEGRAVANPADYALAAELLLSRRRSETFLLGEPFAFSEGTDNGRSDVTVLRFVQDWLGRTPNTAIGARSTFSFGLEALGATTSSNAALRCPGTTNRGCPDGSFFSWLGQAQWVQRLTSRDDQLILRGEIQLADDPLLPLEQYALGGFYTVRGYRENELVSDNGWSASLEGRIPLFRLPVPWVSQTIDDGAVVLAPFIDAGRAWNTDRPTPDNDLLYSVGCGLRWRPSSHILGLIYYGHNFVDVPAPKEHNLQTDGVFFQLSTNLSWQ